MEERTTVIVLRVIAVVTMLIGLILATQAILSVAAVEDLGGAEHSGVPRRSAIWGVVGALTVWGWGLGLFATSSKLARRIHA